MGGQQDLLHQQLVGHGHSRCRNCYSRRGRRPSLPLGLRRWRSSHMGNQGLSRCLSMCLSSNSLASYSFALRSSTRRSGRRSRRVPSPPLGPGICVSIRNARLGCGCLRYGRPSPLAPRHDRRGGRSRCSRRSPSSLWVRHGAYRNVARMFPTETTRKSKARQDPRASRHKIYLCLSL